MVNHRSKRVPREGEERKTVIKDPFPITKPHRHAQFVSEDGFRSHAQPVSEDGLRHRRHLPGTADICGRYGADVGQDGIHDRSHLGVLLAEPRSRLGGQRGHHFVELEAGHACRARAAQRRANQRVPAAAPSPCCHSGRRAAGARPPPCVPGGIKRKHPALGWGGAGGGAGGWVGGLKRGWGCEGRSWAGGG